jgi:hypothetical protein
VIQQDSQRPGFAQLPVAYRQHGQIPSDVCERPFERIDDACSSCNAGVLGPLDGTSATIMGVLDEARGLAECLAAGTSQG